MTENTSQFEHERYEEFCALATARMLTPEESEALSAHLEECGECREIFSQYQTIAQDGVPFLADNFAPPPEPPLFDEGPALARLLHTAESRRQETPPAIIKLTAASWTKHPAFRGAIAAAVLFATTFAAYRLGQNGRAVPSPVAIVQPNPLPPQKQALEQTVRLDEQKLAALEQQAAGYKTDADKLRASARADDARLAALTASLDTAKSQADIQIAALTQERDASIARLHDVQQSYQAVQVELDTLRNQRQQDLLHVASLETQISGLTVALNDQDQRAKADEKYLSSDKDIRDLIGARNLYIADIMDVDASGNSRKPFGRVFYTKTKSLVFYAYDLDSQPGVRRTSTFQVWGRAGSDDRNPINLGMLYMDSETNQRWTLRVDNPQQLAQLDAIFVTIEPRPQSERPTGKPFLYASLRRDANHP